MVRKKPMALGMNQTMFMIGICVSLRTINGVNSCPMKSPRGIPMTITVVAITLCSSLNQYWLILVGVGKVNDMPRPANAWPKRAK